MGHDTVTLTASPTAVTVSGAWHGLLLGFVDNRGAFTSCHFSIVDHGSSGLAIYAPVAFTPPDDEAQGRVQATQYGFVLAVLVDDAADSQGAWAYSLFVDVLGDGVLTERQLAGGHVSPQTVTSQAEAIGVSAADLASGYNMSAK